MIRVLLSAEAVIGQDLDDPALSNLTSSALDDHPLKFLPERFEAQDAALDFTELSLGDSVDRMAGAVRVVCQIEKLADCLQREAELATVANKAKPFQMSLAVTPLVTMGS